MELLQRKSLSVCEGLSSPFEKKKKKSSINVGGVEWEGFSEEL